MFRRVRGLSSSWSSRAAVYLTVVLGLAALGASACTSRGAAPAPEVTSARPWVAPEQARSVVNPVAPTAKALAEMEPVFRLNCAGCHGENGDGNGPASVVLPKKAANFTDARAMAAMTDGELFWKMSTGRAPMPAWNDLLPLEQRWELVNYIRTFAHPDHTASASK